MKLWRKYSLHTHTIRGIEWPTLKSVLTWSNNGQSNSSSNISTANNESGSKLLVKNDILFTDLMTGNRSIHSTVNISQSGGKVQSLLSSRSSVLSDLHSLWFDLTVSLSLSISGRYPMHFFKTTLIVESIRYKLSRNNGF
jgi:hypothetical protein